MIWFLRLFPAYRLLEAEYRAAGERRISLEDEVRWSRNEISAQREEIKGLTEKLDHASKQREDFWSQIMTGRKVYGPAPDLSELQPAPSPIPRAPQGRQIVQMKTAEFYAEEEARIAKARSAS